MPSDVLDVNGAPITIGLEYVVVVLAVGDGSRQLSKFSDAFTLRDEGIYNGTYGMIISRSSALLYDSVSLRSETGQYRGMVIGHFSDPDPSGFGDCPEFLTQTNFGEITFSVSGEAITDFDWTEDSYSFCDRFMPVYEGSGIIVDELEMRVQLLCVSGPCGSSSILTELNLFRL